MSGEGELMLEHAIAPVCLELEVELIDIEFRPGIVSITVDKKDGLNLDQVAAVSRAISEILDENEALGPNENYELEVSSPGLERRLRRPEHFKDALGKSVAIRTVAGTPGERRISGTIASVDEHGIEIALEGSTTRRVAFEEIERARTTVDWQAALREGKTRTKSDKVATL